MSYAFVTELEQLRSQVVLKLETCSPTDAITIRTHAMDGIPGRFAKSAQKYCGKFLENTVRQFWSGTTRPASTLTKARFLCDAWFARVELFTVGFCS
jgi:hypothetical protein